MIRVQLSKNFQVVELTFDSFSDMEINTDEIDQAVELVNRLGDLIDPSTKIASSTSKMENPPTLAQLALCKRLNIDVKGKDKEQVRQIIKEAISKWVKSQKKKLVLY